MFQMNCQLQLHRTLACGFFSLFSGRAAYPCRSSLINFSQSVCIHLHKTDLNLRRHHFPRPRNLPTPQRNRV
ncbi:hypothetical protein BKA60DRAFT_568993 [Fusarium oxysporum]|nr:hypothetical protein BKA60DRAFT_568993 [Fusarium oxysporum]